jgi:beta-glucosidase
MMTAPAPGTLNMDFAFTHCSTCEDAETIKVWIDNNQIYNYDHAATHGRRAPTPPFQLAFADTRPHHLRIEYTHQAPHFGAGLTLNWKPPLAVLRQQAVAAASQSDAVVLFLGLSPELEGEEMPVSVQGFRGGDRTSIELPDAQQQLVSAIAATGKPIVLVLMNGSAIALGDTAKKSAAILEAWYPGQAGGTAIAETLFGENNPSGRLPITFYASTAQLPPFDDYSMSNRTYRYFSGEPLYGFGYGLSYTRFGYSAGKLSMSSVQAGQPLKVQVEVKNEGKRDGAETIEAYLIPQHASRAPLRQLVGFQKMQLRRGQSKTVQMILTPRQLSLVSADGTRSVESGEYKLYIGGGQPGQSAGVLLPFQVVGRATVRP